MNNNQTIGMSPHDAAVYWVKKAAENDFSLGRPCDAWRHHARPGSAWAVWYEKAYAAQAANTQVQEKPCDS
jgi:hypothetical protein